MSFGTTLIQRAGTVAIVAMFAIVPTVMAQDATPAANLDELEGAISTDGSSTVGPMTAAVVEEFADAAPGVDVVVDISGTGGGFERFCEGDTEISNASRAIAEDEIDRCEVNGFDYYEFVVATDGLTVVVNSENDFITCLTVEQLNQLWAPESDVATWADLNGDWPDETINLYGPGTDSGTFDFFTDVINGEEGASRTDYQPSEDDNVIVQGVANDQYALGYFGLAYYLENQEILKAVEIDNGEGCVASSVENVENGSYTPLSRPLFIYVRADALQERPEVQEFMRFYLDNAANLAGDVGYVGLPDDMIAEQQEKLEGAIDGSVAPDNQQESASPEATPAS